jgi:hypothetical protein
MSVIFSFGAVSIEAKVKIGARSAVKSNTYDWFLQASVASIYVVNWFAMQNGKSVSMGF